MSESTVAIVGSGISATAMVREFVARGHDVTVFEKGPDFPYPHTRQFTEQVKYRWRDPKLELPRDLKDSEVTGDYGFPLENERAMVVGGCGTHWQGIAHRMHPSDFRTRTLHGFGDDWPVGYDDLEPYYGRAEAMIGVSGTDEDNPFAPPRSTPYPLPAFALSHDDVMLKERLEKKGLALHTTPQARTRQEYDGRSACMNFGACHVCPVGARYSPNFHLLQAIGTGRVTLRTETSVRRIVPGPAGGRSVLVVRGNGAASDEEHAARVVIVAAGAIETSRLVLLSALDGRLPGLGKEGGTAGQGFVFHEHWWDVLRYPDKLFPGRVGAFTGQSQQFANPPTRGRHGGVKVEFSSQAYWEGVTRWGTRDEIRAQVEPRLYDRPIGFQSETAPDPGKYVALSSKRDRFGDPLARVHYELSDFDRETFAFVSGVHDRFVEATQAERKSIFPDPRRFGSGAHHMSGCRMGKDATDSVVDLHGRLHGSPGVFLAGGSTFVGCSGAQNPTLTMVALALRTADHVNRHVL